MRSTGGEEMGDGQGWVQQTLGNSKEDISVHEEANECAEQKNLAWVMLEMVSVALMWSPS